MVLIFADFNSCYWLRETLIVRINANEIASELFQLCDRQCELYVHVIQNDKMISVLAYGQYASSSE